MNRLVHLVLAYGWLIAVGSASAQDFTNQPGAPPATKPAAAIEEERAQLAERVEREWARLPLDSKVRLLKLHRALREMPPEERCFIHDRVEKFLNMSPEERERLRRNKRRWEQMTPEQRQKARERFEQRKREFEARWRQEHPGEPVPPFPPHRLWRWAGCTNTAPHHVMTNGPAAPLGHLPPPAQVPDQSREIAPHNP